ncbi:MAG: dUTP diphosphatase [Fusobacteriaceae bacterium]
MIKKIYEMQKRLDTETMKPRSNGFTPRAREESHIVRSLIAEVIELDEELEDLTHKTWKKKEFDKSKVLEELTDVFFFLVQWINYKKLEDVCELSFASETYEGFGTVECMLNVIGSASRGCLGATIFNYKTLVHSLDHKMKDIYECYEIKWNKNMKRIETEWNGL